MKITANGRNKEPFERLFRRFNRKIQESGVLTAAKENRFHSRSPNRRKIRASAVRRSQIKKTRYREFKKRGGF